MQTQPLSIKAQRRRKMLLLLPLLILPFITLLFWAVGGGQIKQETLLSGEDKGFNTKLPDAAFKEEGILNKLSYYDQAATDSIELLEQRRKDPNTKSLEIEESFDSNWESTLEQGNLSSREESKLKMQFPKSNREAEIYERLEKLQKITEEPNTTLRIEKTEPQSKYDAIIDQEQQQMQEIMQQIKTPAVADPELQQLGGMLENILDIQHPERVKEKLKQKAAVDAADSYRVTTLQEDVEVTSLQSKNMIEKKTFRNDQAFYSIGNLKSDQKSNAIEATWHETQVVISGTTIKLRLNTDLYVNGILIQRNSFLYGNALLKGERLMVEINSIAYKNMILPVHLSAYDLDGIEGIYIPGALSREVAKESGNQSLQSIGLSAIDDSWSTQAAGMGIEAAKSFLSKKVKLVKVVVKAGYKMLLFDEKQK